MEQPPIQLLVTRHPNGHVEVTSNAPMVLGDKLFCYGLLEAAKDAIRDYQPPKTNGIVMPGMLDGLAIRQQRPKG